MIYLLFFGVSLIACAVGGICGVGGGIIIKPVLDAAGVMSVTAVSFLSGCTVLSMAVISFFRNRKQKGTLDLATSTPLAAGAVLGGLVGKALFDLAGKLLQNDNLLGASQAAVLLVITIGSILYSLFAEKIKTLNVKNLAVCGAIGFGLGALSSFLGIGGGPINLTVLFFFFSMDTKKAAANSLYIILFSQLASLVQTVLRGAVPDVSPWLLVLMVAAGVMGGILGGNVNKRMDAKTVSKLFMGFMAVIVLINIYNILKFTVL